MVPRVRPLEHPKGYGDLRSSLEQQLWPAVPDAQCMRNIHPQSHRKDDTMMARGAHRREREREGNARHPARVPRACPLDQLVWGNFDRAV